MASNANQPQASMPPASPSGVGPETVQPHQMNEASLYLEEQNPKYYYQIDRNAALPEAILHEHPKYYHQTDLNTPLPEAIDVDKEKAVEVNAKEITPKKKIFGIRRRFFIIGVVVFLIVLVAAVGGGVGASTANKNQKSEAEAAAATTSAIKHVSIGETPKDMFTWAAPMTATVTETVIQSTRANTMSTTTRETEPTKTKSQATKSTEVCAEGTVADGESQNYLGLCKFSCGYGYCPPGPCTCVAFAKPRKTPDVTNVRGCPLPDLSDGYLGLCSFACNHGYCPKTACTTDCKDR